MSDKNKIVDTEIIGNIMLILSTSIIVCLIALFYITNDSHAAVMISIAISSFLVIGYWIYSFFRPRKEDNNK
jgi:O-antigen/teichoic acid export membrane protein